jgi:ABC-type transport system involved in cytochrome bd biosynthesis fused ATPase/permease subunit
LVGEGESGSASTIYGPVRAGLTTSPATNKEAQLSELLSCLEKRVEILESKYLEVCDTFQSVTARLAALSLTIINETIIDEERDSK